MHPQHAHPRRPPVPRAPPRSRVRRRARRRTPARTAKDGTVTVWVDDHPQADEHIAHLLARAITDWLTTTPHALDTVPAPQARRTDHTALHRDVAVRRVLVDHLAHPDPRTPFSDRLAHLMTDLAPHLRRSPR